MDPKDKILQSHENVRQKTTRYLWYSLPGFLIFLVSLAYGEQGIKYGAPICLAFIVYGIVRINIQKDEPELEIFKDHK